jgi:glycosyltransferase involved in cell wall biosynthesis
MKTPNLNNHFSDLHNSNPKIAIVCDWITGTGGAERVIKSLHDIFPDAPIYTSTYEIDSGTLFKNADIRTAWFQKLPKFLRKHQLLTMPRQWHFGHLKLKGYDVVISAGGAEAKAVRAIDGVHINICYTPTLYYWVKPEEYLNKDGSGGINPIWRLGLKVLTPHAKRWDLKASKRPDKMLAISTAVQKRIKNIYGRNCDILFPPTNIERFTSGQSSVNRQGYVTFGRQVQHKRFDLAISACNELQVPLLVIGDGPEHTRLKSIAGSTISFKTNVSDEQMVDYISRAEAFIFPNEEDFGIVAVEAQAAGVPVIAYRAGGSLDTVIEGVTGEFFDLPNSTSLAKTIKDFNYKLYNRQAILENARKFSEQNFHNNLKSIIKNLS